MIIGLETAFFDEKRDVVLSRYEGNRIYAEYMLELLGMEGTNTSSGQIINMKVENLQQLFSLTYFQSAMNLVAEKGISYYGNNRVGIADDNYKGAYYQPDGGYVYSEEFQQQDAEYVKNHAEEKYKLSNRITPGLGVNEKSKETLIKLVEYLRNQGTEVEIFICPFAPSLWDRIDFEEFPIILEMDEFLREYASENDIRIIGGINPYEFGMTDADFYDARHIRKERLNVYFDFTE